MEEELRCLKRETSHEDLHCNAGASLVQRVPAGAVRVAPGSPTAAYGAVTPFDTAAGVKGSATERDSALRECSVISRRYQQTTWANMDIQQHRACMAQHGQPE